MENPDRPTRPMAKVRVPSPRVRVRTASAHFWPPALPRSWTARRFSSHHRRHGSPHTGREARRGRSGRWRQNAFWRREKDEKMALGCAVSSAFLLAKLYRLKPLTADTVPFPEENGGYSCEAVLVTMHPMTPVPHPSPVIPDPFARNPARAGEGGATGHFVTRGRSRPVHDNDFLVPPVWLTNHDGAFTRISVRAVGIVRMAMMAGSHDHCGFRWRQAAGEKSADGEGDGEDDFHGYDVVRSWSNGRADYSNRSGITSSGRNCAGGFASQARPLAWRAHHR